jgi:predicted acyltransferase
MDRLNTHIRFPTLDVFRGLAVFLMIVVNTQGSQAPPFSLLQHAKWNGCTLADLVFPSFLFAVGNAMAFTAKKMEGKSNREVLGKIARRTLLIFLIGFLLAWYPFVNWDSENHLTIRPLGETRILAVLQRIALVYGLSALLIRFLSVKSIRTGCVVLLAGYWAILYFAGDPPSPYSISGNAVRKLDLMILGPQHMYREQGIAFDPEGLLSTLPALVNTLAGYLAGRYIIKEGKTYKTFAVLLIAGNLLLLAALCWSPFLPVNKKLWTSSFVLLTTAIDLIVVALLFYLIEIKQWKKGLYFFMVFGRNPLFIYVLSNLLGVFFLLRVAPGHNLIDWVNAVFFQRLAPGPWGCLLFSLAFTLICWSIGWLLDRRHIFIRL